MPYTIVDYTASYHQPLRQLYLEVRQQAFTWQDPAGFALPDFDAVTQGETILVAVSAGAAIGFVAWWPPDNFIHSLFVAPAHTGKGVGKSLLTACLAQIGRPATLKCLRENKKALGFYRAQGWTVSGAGETSEGAYLLLAFPGAK
jgi:GNAT superfamily N-acetyltransferase